MDLRNEKGRTWLPMFTSAAAACADRSTSARPMADYTLQDAMELALSTEGIDGVVLDPWSHSATLDGALLNGLLHAGHTPEDPGDEKADAGKEAARKGNWAQAVECFEKAAELGSAMGLALLADCIYKGRGTRTNRAKARRMWKEAADSGEILSNIALGDDCAARGDNGRALLYYRRARATQPYAGYRVHSAGVPACGPDRNALHQPQKGAGIGRRSKAGLCHQGP